MIKTDVLNVTEIEPRLKHPTIFEHFDAMVPGEAFVILNDHDPKPLYYQLLGERGNIFTWEYLEAGPEWWRVRIAKPSEDEKKETIGEIAAKDIRKAEVFKKLGIDFCCGGKKSLKEAAQEAGLDEQQVEQALEQADKLAADAGTVHDYFNWDISFLADYIYNVHHRYVRENGPIIEQLADKVALRHGSERKELYQLAEAMHLFMEGLYKHLQNEERDLFPIIKKLEAGTAYTAQQAQEAVTYMEKEHEDAGEELRNLRKITADYKLPANACNSYTYLYQKIQEFESDLLKHIHLENNILFPKAVALEKQRIA